MLKKGFLIVGLIILLLIGVSIWGLRTSPKNIEDIQITSIPKPVILLMVDSLMADPLEKVVKEGKTPALQFLMESGRYHPRVISSYPTMSVTIDTTILTGAYADQHTVPGLIWFDENENKLINYGTGMREVRKQGIRKVIKDGYSLNQEHVSNNVSTIYEELSNFGLQSASINGLVYRGTTSQAIQVPRLATVTNLVPYAIEMKGPELLSLGRFSQYNPNNAHNKLWDKMGFNDNFSTSELRYLIKKDKLPAFSLVYFPSMDKKVHKNGPSETKGIKEVDQQIQTILDSFPSWEIALEEAIWVISGDSGQTAILNDKEKAMIKLDSLLQDYQIWDVTTSFSEKEDLVFAVNERMAYIYIVNPELRFTEVISKLQTDQRIGFLAWKENGKNIVVAPGKPERFMFKPGGDYTDTYQQSWEIEGNHTILDVDIDSNKAITYGEYPDALARLHGALHSHPGKFIIVDAKPGYEIVGKYSPTHLGGAGHGSLHLKDSVVPLIVAGTESEPKYTRLVDYKEWILGIVEEQVVLE